MINFEDSCERVNLIFKRGGYPGIGEVRESNDSWIFFGALDSPDEIEYGGYGPYIVDKQSGDLRILNFNNDDEWSTLERATKLEDFSYHFEKE